MYLNVKKFKKSKLTPDQLLQLVFIKQREKDMIKEEYFSYFESIGYIKYIKGTKSSSKVDLVRITSTGGKLLNDLTFNSEWEESTEVIAEWIINVYKNKEGGIVKNKTELKRRLQWFIDITQIKGNFLAILIQLAMLDTYNTSCGHSFNEAKKENSRLILSNMAENLFWTPSSHFDRNYTLDKSPLYTYFQDNEDFVRNEWSTKLNEEGVVKKDQV